MIQHTEYWKIVDANPNYEVSTLGRVRRIDGLPIKSCLNNSGYMSCVITNRSRPNKAQNLLVHRMVAIAFIPNPEMKRTVNHIDGNKSNNNIANLEWNTYRENLLHARTSGLKPNKLSEKDIVDIMELRRQGVSRRQIAIRYSVFTSTICRCIRRFNSSKTVKH